MIHELKGIPKSIISFHFMPELTKKLCRQTKDEDNVEESVIEIKKSINYHSEDHD